MQRQCSKNSKLIFFLGLWLFCLGAQASFVDSYLLSHPKIMIRQVSRLLAKRCAIYTRDAEQCELAADEMFRYLDIAPITIRLSNLGPVQYIVTFKSQLDQLKSMPGIINFLTDLHSQLEIHINNIKIYRFVFPENITPFDIGLFAKDYFKSQELALSALAVLFQDMPSSSVQIRYLVQQPENRVLAKLLSQVMAQISELGAIKGRLPLEVFGRQFASQRIYHLLVPAAISQRLRQQGFSIRVAMATAFLFNYLYEAKDVLNPLLLQLVEPSSIQSHVTAGDILDGELGARLGVGVGLLPTGSLDQKRALMKESASQYLIRATRVVE